MNVKAVILIVCLVNGVKLNCNPVDIALFIRSFKGRYRQDDTPFVEQPHGIMVWKTKPRTHPKGKCRAEREKGQMMRLWEDVPIILGSCAITRTCWTSFFTWFWTFIKSSATEDRIVDCNSTTFITSAAVFHLHIFRQGDY